MIRIVATIQLKTTKEGGRATPVSTATYRATAFFENVPTLGSHGYDFRMVQTGSEIGKWIMPGGSADEVELRFLSANEVLGHLRPGTKFSLWEGKTIGSGTVTKVEGSPDK